METKIIEEKQNPLFNRKEVVLEVKAEITPSFADAEKIISEKFSAQPEVFKIKGIRGSFGSKVFKISANIYPSEQEKDDTETKTKQEKEAEKKAVEEEAKPAEEVKEETPAEEEKPKEPEAKSEEKSEPKEEKSEVPEQEKSEVSEKDKKTQKEVKETQAEVKGK